MLIAEQLKARCDACQNCEGGLRVRSHMTRDKILSACRTTTRQNGERGWGMMRVHDDIDPGMTLPQACASLPYCAADGAGRFC